MGFLGNNHFLMDSLGANLGYRCYFNDRDPIQAYASGQLGVGLLQFWCLDLKSGSGLLWSINDHIGIFSEANLSLVGLVNSNESIGNGIQLALTAAFGVHARF